jgi:hypothetical protein
VGSPCVHNLQLLMQSNARMSHGGKSLCAQPSGVMQCNDELLWEVFCVLNSQLCTAISYSNL